MRRSYIKVQFALRGNLTKDFDCSDFLLVGAVGIEPTTSPV
jgi:hypothetical protein